jgi:uncharacterized repeat protein (TIGR01451 family)
MKVTKIGFRQGFGIVTAMGLLGLVLGFALVPLAKVSADVTCTTETQGGVGNVDSNSTACLIPSGVTITGATLTYTLDDGGEVYVEGQQVFAVAPDQGTNTGTINISTNLFTAGDSFLVKVVARNAMDSSGNVIGEVFGSASVHVSTSTVAQNPSVDLSANPSTIEQGDSSTLSWESENADSCSASWTTSHATSGSKVVSPSSTTTYSITCENDAGSDTDTATVTVTSQSNLPTVDLTASDTSIDSGDTTTLIWEVENASSCQASGAWSGSVSPSGGSQVVGPLFSNKTYNIRCQNNNGDSDTDSVTIVVGNTNNGQAPEVTTKSATNIETDQATLRGEVDGNGLSTRVWFEWGRNRSDVEDGDGEETDDISTGSGSDTFDDDIDGLREDTTYYFRAVARNSEGTDYGSVLSFRTDSDNNNDRTCNDRNAINYRDSGSCRYANLCQDSGALNYRGSLPCRYPTVQNRPTVILTADQTSVAFNGATFVRWSTISATSCQASDGSLGWAGPKSIGPGSFYTGSLSSSKTYTLTCFNNSGSDTKSVTISVRRPSTGGPTPPPASSLVLVTSSIDRNQPILPTLDNTRPRPGDEITYTVNYQNIGTGAIRNLVLRLDLPYEVVYLYSTPPNPVVSGNTLIFNLGTLAANGSGTVTVRVRVREDAPPGALLNFPAVLSYIDPAGFPQTVSANVSAQVWNMQPVEDNTNTNLLGAAAFLSGGFWPTTLFGWLLLIILILLLVLLARYLMGGGQPFERKTTTTTIQH